MANKFIKFKASVLFLFVMLLMALVRHNYCIII